MNYYKNISYSFSVQSYEDFYNQLRAFHREDWKLEQEIDVSDLTLAREALASIGIKCLPENT